MIVKLSNSKKFLQRYNHFAYLANKIDKWGYFFCRIEVSICQLVVMGEVVHVKEKFEK